VGRHLINRIIASFFITSYSIEFFQQGAHPLNRCFCHSLPLSKLAKAIGMSEGNVLGIKLEIGNKPLSKSSANVFPQLFIDSLIQASGRKEADVVMAVLDANLDSPYSRGQVALTDSFIELVGTDEAITEKLAKELLAAASNVPMFGSQEHYEAKTFLQFESLAAAVSDSFGFTIEDLSLKIANDGETSSPMKVEDLNFPIFEAFELAIMQGNIAEKLTAYQENQMTYAMTLMPLKLLFKEDRELFHRLIQNVASHPGKRILFSDDTSTEEKLKSMGILYHGSGELPYALIAVVEAVVEFKGVEVPTSPGSTSPSDETTSRSEGSSPLGGINLNPDLLDLQIKRDGNGVPLPIFQQQPIADMNIQGFIPVIINVMPVTNLPALLGLNPCVDEEENCPSSGELSYLRLLPINKKDRLKVNYQNSA